MPIQLPQNVISELKTWLSDVSQKFGVNGETGIDIGTHGKIDLPVYAVTAGKVIGAGYYGGGGVVSEQSNINYAGINGPASIYYQHLDQVLAKVGEIVSPGQLIGLSGGQLSGGHHPSSSQFSNGPHIEIGINAPYGKANQSIWSPLGPNVNPLAFFQALASGNTDVLGIGNGPTSIPIVSGVQDAVNNVTDLPSAIASLPQGITNSISTALSNAIKNEESVLGISGPSDIGWRIILIVIGFILMISAILFIGFDLLDKSNIEVAGSRV
jgi:hypothetical protein